MLALQRTAGNAAVGRMLARRGASATAEGEPLDSATRGRMAGAFGGADLSGVRVHVGGEAAALTAREGARALAAGEDIAFAPGEYQPGTPLGDALLAHEIAHVVQERGGANDAPSVPARALERDADRSARAVLARLWAGFWDPREGAPDARPRLRSPLELRACIRGCTPEQERQLRGLAGELMQMSDPDAIANRLASVDDATLDTAERALRDEDGERYRDTIQARAVAWEGAWRHRSWTRLVELSNADRDGLRAPYRSRIVQEVMAGSLTMKAHGPSAWRDWVRQKLLDLTERPRGFQLVADLVATGQDVTLQPPSQAGTGFTTQRHFTEADPNAGRFDRDTGTAGHATGSTVVLDQSVAGNQVVIGGTPQAPQMIDAEETVTVGHELIHALHNARGENIALLSSLFPDVHDPFGLDASAEELWTVQGQTTFEQASGRGTVSFRVTPTVSENDLRRERGLPLRVGHGGALRDFVVRAAGGERPVDLVPLHYGFRAPQRWETAPTEQQRARVLDALRAMVTERLGSGPLPAGPVPLPHPRSFVLWLQVIHRQPDLENPAGLLEPRP